MKQKIILLAAAATALALLVSCAARGERDPVAPAPAAPADVDVEETPAERDARMRWWREAKFGLFIHWGIYAVPAGTYQGKRIRGIGEWIMLAGKIPVAEYRAFGSRFNPVKYDPEQWASLAEEAGTRYVVITAKHHDGFALYDSSVTDWDVAGATPYGKDLLAPLVSAVKRRGLKMGLYYSQAQDWIHPGGAKLSYEEGGGWDDAHKGDFDTYLREIAYPQTREILTSYDIDILWWDTPAWMNEERARPFLPLLRLRPGIIQNNRLGGGYRGDTDTPQQRVPATGIPGRDWEVCMTMNGTWGYKSYDDNWKSTEDLIHKLVDIVSKGGNFLLNIGPKADGTIPQESIDRLRAVGAWMKVNGEAIYATHASPTQRPLWGRLTAKPTTSGTRLYLHVLRWPADGVLPVAVRNEVLGCSLLADGTRTFTTTPAERGLTVALTGEAPDPICSVVVLDIAGEPQVVDLSTRQAADGSLSLRVADAGIHNPKDGKRARVERRGGTETIGNWHDARAWVEWAITVTTPGTFHVELEIATPTADCQLTVAVRKQRLTAAIPSTGSYDTYQAARLGTLTIKEPGLYQLSVKPVKKGWKPLELRGVRLIPAGDTPGPPK